MGGELSERALRDIYEAIAAPGRRSDEMAALVRRGRAAGWMAALAFLAGVLLGWAVAASTR